MFLCTSQWKPRPPDPRDIAGDVTFLQCYIWTFTLALGGIWTVTILAPRAPVSKARRALLTGALRAGIVTVQIPPEGRGKSQNVTL